MAEGTGVADESTVLKEACSGTDRSPLLRDLRALPEFLVLLVMVAGALWLGGRVEAPLADAGCGRVVGFELALPRGEAVPSGATNDIATAAPASVSPSPVLTVRGLRTIDGAVSGCRDDGRAQPPSVVSGALKKSTYLDFGFIVFYVVLLGWCCLRAAGWRTLSIPLSGGHLD